METEENDEISDKIGQKKKEKNDVFLRKKLTKCTLIQLKIQSKQRLWNLMSLIDHNP